LLLLIIVGADAVLGDLSTVVVPVTVDDTVLVVFEKARPVVRIIIAIAAIHINQSCFI
tara:strand:- start:246 stop:419 length:174 start_codon:yes stop_codon:yes gene_type:complete